MFHLMAYRLNPASAQVLADVPAINDTVITTRNSHFILTDPFNLVMAYGLGSTISELRANWPTLNAYGYHQFWPFDNQGTTLPVVPDRPALIDYWSQPMSVPDNEELAIQVSATPATTENDVLGLWLATPNHQLVLPSGIQRLTVKANYTIVTGAAYAWSGAGVLTFETTFRGGWYAVVGLNVFDAGTLFARLIFPKATQYNGRVLRPGCIAQNTAALRPSDRFMGKVGPWGFFNSFEQPQIEIFSTTAASHSGDCRFDLVYLGGGAAPQGY